jgi:hypothetical protein
MAAIVVTDAFDLASFYQTAKERLPAYARPMFLRMCAGRLGRSVAPEQSVICQEDEYTRLDRSGLGYD